MTFLYFAYGSNLLRQRLQLCNPSAQFVAVAELQDHTLSFSCVGVDPTAKRWKGGAASIVEHTGKSVWGCIWRLGNEHLQSLDRQELVYNSKDVNVTTVTKKEHTCRTYQLPRHHLEDTSRDNRPSPMYMDIILKGAVQNELPPNYVEFLESIETNGLNDDSLEIYRDILKQFKDR